MAAHSGSLPCSPAQLKHAIFEDRNVHLVIFEENDNMAYDESVFMKIVYSGSVDEYMLIYDYQLKKYISPDHAEKWDTVTEMVYDYLDHLMTPGSKIILINTLGRYGADCWDGLPNGIITINPRTGGIMKYKA